MGILDDILVDDALAFVDEDGFGESVVYTKAKTGATRTINAVIERFSPMPGPGQGSGVMPMMRARVANSVTTGIASSEWNNGDTLTVAERRGATTKRHQLHWPSDAAEHDAGMCVFELR